MNLLKVKKSLQFLRILQISLGDFLIPRLNFVTCKQLNYLSNTTNVTFVLLKEYYVRTKIITLVWCLNLINKCRIV